MVVKGKIAFYGIATDVLGLGKRMCFWVKGCLRCCPHCQTPKLQQIEPFEDVRLLVDKIFKEAIAENCSGITISGGEPFLQLEVLRYVIKLRNMYFEERGIYLDILIYTGYKYEELLENNVGEILKGVDILIDGEYIFELDHNKPFIGSINQRLLFLSNYAKVHLRPPYENFMTIGERKQNIDYLEGPCGGIMSIGLKKHKEKII